ncbi:hypothetical protein, unlikely [Trypanosoma congolense IL3000]|uniref:Uncharacterized protein n=1 Tax=Trypanosoma congolense (strain IL3000) TaxID=1068625 RepID=F9WEZ9_TRYCI|nr:hypothetical protein, unlikely [Trypanosoma congolense IL3000]
MQILLVVQSVEGGGGVEKRARTEQINQRRARRKQRNKQTKKKAALLPKEHELHRNIRPPHQLHKQKKPIKKQKVAHRPVDNRPLQSRSEPHFSQRICVVLEILHFILLPLPLPRLVMHYLFLFYCLFFSLFD